MFHIGETILYPMYGTCLILAVETKEILGENIVCYILNNDRARMQISIPLNRAATLGVRQVVATDILDQVLREVSLGETDPIIFENQRSCADINRKRMKTGDIYKGVEIIRDLTRKVKRSKKNKLCAEDVNMLNNARLIFLSELMEVKGLELDQANLLLDDALASCS